MNTPGNHGTVSIAPGAPIGLQTGHSASSSPPYKRSEPWSKHLFSPTNIPQLDGAGSFISEQGLDIRASTLPCFRFSAPGAEKTCI